MRMRCQLCGFWHGDKVKCLPSLRWKYLCTLLSLQSPFPSTEADYWEAGALIRYARWRGMETR
jgi:hypothetical protein